MPKGTPRNEAQERLSFDSLPFQFRLDDVPYDEYERQAAEESYEAASQREAKYANHGADAGEWEDVGRFNSQGHGQGSEGQWEGQGGNATNGIMMDDGDGFNDITMNDDYGFQHASQWEDGGRALLNGEGKQPVRPGAAAAVAAAKVQSASRGSGGGGDGNPNNESLSQDVEYQTALALSASECRSGRDGRSCCGSCGCSGANGPRA